MTNISIKPAEYMRRAREFEAAGFEGAARLAILSTFTAELLRPYLVVECQQLDYPMRPWFGPFGQLEQLVLDKSSPLWQQYPDVLWIALRLEDVDRHLAHECHTIGPAATRDRLAAIRQRLVNLVSAARAGHRASILVSNFVQNAAHDTHLFDASDPDGFVHLVAECNRELARELMQIPDAHVLDYAGAVALAGANTWTDPKLWYMARSGCSSQNMIPLARLVARSAIALVRPAAKCLVLDLDNTLWGGILGDDGAENVQLGDAYPGNVFKDFQAALLGLRGRGFLLAIASKNDEKTVFDMLDSHPEMLLKREHFSAIVANWNPKPEALRTIAKNLNIGLDSLVFVDDSPLERAAVRAELPMVHVVELPSDPLGYRAALAEVPVLDRPRLLVEDRERAQMVKSDSLRQQVQQQATSVEDFLHGLGMVAQVGRANAATLDRIHQLVQKTNQFNLTTRRHNIDDLRRLIDSPAAEVAWLRLADRYGDLGLVCVGIIRALDDRTWVVDTFLMSCRVMGRHVEDAFLAYLVELARAHGAQRLRGVYHPTAKNSPVLDFYSQRGFGDLSGKDLGGKDEHVFEAELAGEAFAWPKMIERAVDKQKEIVSA